MPCAEAAVVSWHEWSQYAPVFGLRWYVTLVALFWNATQASDTPKKQDGSLAQQIRRAAAAAEAEDLEELRRGLRSDVLGARRLFEEQQQAEARRHEEEAELRICVARCRDEAAAACADAKEHWLRFEAAQEAMACGYREGDRKLGAELVVKMSELNAKLGENMAALEAEVTRNVQLQMSSLREELERRSRPGLAEELETKCSSLLKQAEASLGATLAEATEVSRKSFRTARKEHEAFVQKRQKQFHGWVQECQEQLRETRAHCDGLTASALSKVEALQEQEQRRWSGELDCRLGRCEGECQALLSDARQHLQASEETLKEWRSRGEALEHDQRAGIAELRERLEKVDETVTANEKGLQSQRVLIEQLTADFQTLQDRLVVVEGAVSKQSTTVQSLRHKLHSVKEGSCTQLKELQQQITAEVSEARRMQAEGEATQAAAMEEKQQALPGQKESRGRLALEYFSEGKGTLLGDGEVSHYGSTPLPQKGRSLGTGTIFACFLGVASCLGEAEASSQEACQKGLGTLSLAWLAMMELALDLHLWLNSIVTGTTSLLADGISAFQASESCPLSKRFEGKTLHDAVPMVTVLMMMGILYFVFFLCCLRSDPACNLSTQMCYLFHASFLMALVSYHQAVVTDPGRVPESWREGPGTRERVACMILERKKSTGEMRFCSKEMKYKPDRAHFCSNMQRNVLRMDHYCPWMGNCIGFANYKYFLLFLFYTVIATDAVFGFAVAAIWAGALVPGTAAFVLEAWRWYCSRNCQEKDWKLGHKGDCGLAVGGLFVFVEVQGES
ncbi:pfa3 [Symbiodinium sp. CCMP2592]|nr:pfa3 [Symbiodinium sp. CCMP2592]